METKEKEEKSVDQKVEFLWTNFWKLNTDISNLDFKIERLLLENNIVYNPKTEQYYTGGYILYCFDKIEKYFDKLKSKTRLMLIISLSIITGAAISFLFQFILK